MKKPRKMTLDEAVLYGCSSEHPRGFFNFVKLAWKHSGDASKLVPTRLMQELCHHYQCLFTGHLKTDLIINLPPAHSKSVISNVLFPAWVWGPAGGGNKRFAHISFDSANSLRDAEKSRRLILSAWYQKYWPLSIRRNENKQHMYTNSSNGYRYSSTLQGGITGKHFDFILLDDPANPSKIAMSRVDELAAELERGRQFWDVTLPSRRANEHARVVVIMQRLCEGDLVGYIEEQGHKHEKLCLPAFYDPDVSTQTSVGGDWRKKDGALLAPEIYSEEYIRDKMNKMSPDAAAAQYQQSAAPTGLGIFQIEDFPQYSELPRQGNLYIHTDATLKGRTSSASGDNRSYWVSQVWLESNDTMYYIEGIRLQGDFVVCTNALCELADKWVQRCAEHNRNTRGGAWSTVACTIEDQASGPAAMSVLESYLPDNGWLIEPWKTGEKSKVARAEATRPFVVTGKVQLPDTLTDSFKYEIGVFPKGRHDDQVDAMVQAILCFAERRQGFDSGNVLNRAEEASRKIAANQMWGIRSFGRF